MPRLFMNLLCRFYFMRAAARGTKTKTAGFLRNCWKTGERQRNVLTKKDKNGIIYCVPQGKTASKKEE
ncbi:hypothetical protein DW766_13935 [Butyricicoccus sp. AM29-23AC]|nr:hypothetical protein DW766_13935 [Butyricicoccus sp. AM29-23AC]